MNVKQAIGRMTRLQATLEMPVQFYVRHISGWRDLAREICQIAMQNSRPIDADEALWQASLEELVQRVNAKLLALPSVGALISLRANAKGITDDPSSPSNFKLGDLSIQEVERWVEAGRGKEDADSPGKNLDERDESRSDLQIAWRIMFALIHEKPGHEGLMVAILRFLRMEGKREMQEQLGLVLEMWFEAFQLRAAADWRAWVHEQVAMA